MSRTGWIILASVLIVGAGVGTYFIVKAKKGDGDDKKEDK
jgi:hypothetical protein